MIDGKVVLLYLQVDDITVACSDPIVAEGLIAAKIAKYLWSILNWGLLYEAMPPSTCRATIAAKISKPLWSILNWAACYTKQSSQRLAERLSYQATYWTSSSPSSSSDSLRHLPSNSPRDAPRPLSVRRSTKETLSIS
jgi:hypothetical protein